MKTKHTIAERAASAAAYLPLIGRIILLCLPTRRNAGVRFHVFQATLFGIVNTFLLATLFAVGHVYGVGLLKPYAFADVLLLITLASTAFLAKPIALPVLGGLARKLAAFSDPRQALMFLASGRPQSR